MGHSQGKRYSHRHHHSNNEKTLLLAFFLIASFMVVEVIGGLVTNSLALISNAGHMFSDTAALGLSLFAIKFAKSEPSVTKTFGYKRFEIIAAALNGLTLIIISLYIIYEAYHRILNPPEVQNTGMLIIAVIGLIVNILAAWILTKGDKDEHLNDNSAYLHVLGDMFGSVCAIVAAFIILFWGWGIADPIASVIVSFFIFISGWRIMNATLHILMEGAPEQLPLDEIKRLLISIPNVEGVHDLHIWSITSGVVMLSCHLTISVEGDHDWILHESQSILQCRFGLEHCTIQVESEINGCPSESGACN